ncbi:GDP-mannose 4,6-dehydratase [candidate division WOR-3 bacterium]|nr:GDP-mannose 4,6-dehydratase [candidate division WOR-3 bacterium]
MTYLITGGAGFIGSHLTQRLLREGKRVICLDNLSTGDMRNIEQNKSQGYKFIRGDVTKPIEIEEKADVVFHLASPASPPDYFRFPVETLLTGSVGTYNALNYALKNGALFFLSSTSEIYGDPLTSPQNEEYCGSVNPIWPRSVYEVSKRFSESMTMTFHREFGLSTRIVRIFNTYGPNMRLNDGRSIPNFVRSALSGQDITIYGDGSQTRSYCYIDDVVDAFLMLIDADYYLPINVGNPEEITIKELADSIVEATGSKSKIVFNKPLDDDPKTRKPDIGKAKHILGWEPKINLHQGLNLMIEAFRCKN